MKLNLVYLFPYKFTEYSFYKFEISKLSKDKNINPIIHDLSEILGNEKLNSTWRTKIEKRTSKFRTIKQWLKTFDKLKRKKTVIFNFIPSHNLSGFIINYFVKISKLPIIKYSPVGPYSQPSKKDLRFYIKRLKEHKFNFKLYFFWIKFYFFQFLINRINSGKVFCFSNKNIVKNTQNSSISEVEFNTYDYSNALSYKKEKKKLKKYIIYLDNGAPYFAGDAHLKNDPFIQKDLAKQYNDLNYFLDKLEKFFNAKVIVIPHPKYKSPNKKKIKSLNPFFNKRIVNNDYDALAKLSSNCLFFVNKFSTAMSYAIFFNKPIINIYSSQYFHPREEFESIFHQAKLIGNKPIDICNFNKQIIVQNLKVRPSKYKFYKYNFLTVKNKSVESKENYKLIKRLAHKEFS
tara:strand:- start:368 stop:1576 length:1209 start_codon:yes stop_codon:yes gene_type:complete